MLTLQKKCPVCFVFSCALVHGYSSAGGNNFAFLPWQESVNVCNYLKFQNTVRHPSSSRRKPAGLFQKCQLNPLIPEAIHLSVPDWNLAISAQLASLMWMGLTHITNLLPTLHVPTHAPWQSIPNPDPQQPTNSEKLFSLPKNPPRSPSPGPCSRRLLLSTPACGHRTWHWRDTQESGSTVSFTAGFTAGLQAPCSDSTHKALSTECHRDRRLHCRRASYKAKIILENRTDTDGPCCS